MLREDFAVVDVVISKTTRAVKIVCVNTHTHTHTHIYNSLRIIVHSFFQQTLCWYLREKGRRDKLGVWD